MSELQVFSNAEFGSVRSITVNGEPYFVGKDVAEILGYGNTRDALIAHVDEEDRTVIQKSEIPTLDIPNRGLTVINESGLYSLILSIRLPSAKRFKRWVTSEVLPAIRKHGVFARKVAQEIGMDLFDDTTYQPHRLMYWPSTSSNGEYVFRVMDGDILDPDDYLGLYDDWRDVSTWPVSSRESEAVEKSAKQQADPLAKTGVVGAFCRTYPIRETIEKFLPDVYAPSAMEGRYDYIPADSSAGVIIIDEKFAYSFHATDPACGQLLNAFDAVRVHKFPDDDPKKSYNAMAEFAVADERVKLRIFEEKRQAAAENFDEADPDAWKKQLQYEKKSMELKNNLHNLMLILENDENLKGIVFNQLADGMEIRGNVPWPHPAKFWRDADDAQLICYVDAAYGTFSARNYDIAVTKAVDDRSYHPIREFFETLPDWDGVERADTLLIEGRG